MSGENFFKKDLDWHSDYLSEIRKNLKIKSHFFEKIFFIERISEVSGIIGAIGILFSAGVLTYEVIMRYVFETPTIWEIEFSVYLLIMATFVGAAYGLKNGSHIHIDLVIRFFSSQTRTRLFLSTSIIAFIFCLLLAITGWRIWWEALSKGWKSDSLWGPPLWIPYLFLPLGVTLLCLQYLIQIYNIWMQLKLDSINKGNREERKGNL